MATSLALKPEVAPIEVGADGAARVGGTRIRLDTVVYAFNAGATPEEIVARYPSLRLADAYAVIAYYLRNQQTVDEYVTERASLADVSRRNIESQSNLVGVRARLLARRNNSG